MYLLPIGRRFQSLINCPLWRRHRPHSSPVAAEVFNSYGPCGRGFNLTHLPFMLEVLAYIAPWGHMFQPHNNCHFGGGTNFIFITHCGGGIGLVLIIVGRKYSTYRPFWRRFQPQVYCLSGRRYYPHIYRHSWWRYPSCIAILAEVRL